MYVLKQLDRLLIYLFFTIIITVHNNKQWGRGGAKQKNSDSTQAGESTGGQARRSPQS